MFRIVKALVLSGAVAGVALFADAPKAEAGGWGVSLYSGGFGYPGVYQPYYGGYGNYGGYGGYGGYGVGYGVGYSSFYRGGYGIPGGGYYRAPYHHHHHCR